MDLHKKPALVPLAYATPADVFGDEQTRKVEQEVIHLITLAPRPAHGDTSPEVADRIFEKLQNLVGSINDAEQLERFAYWCVVAKEGKQPDSNLGIIGSAFNFSLGSLKKHFPDQAAARIYDLANLVNADAHVGEEIDECLIPNGNTTPEWSVPSCYVWITESENHPNELDKTQGTIDFNLTRFLRQKWYPYWTGKYRYALRCSFLLFPDGSVKNLSIKTKNFNQTASEKVRLAKIAVEQILKTGLADTHLPKFQKAAQIELQFFD